jgi:hypothetical protein
MTVPGRLATEPRGFSPSSCPRTRSEPSESLVQCFGRHHPGFHVEVNGFALIFGGGRVEDHHPDRASKRSMTHAALPDAL